MEVMRIVEIELVNHIVLPAHVFIMLNRSDDLICIDGLNGSGKSFLLNCIHPHAISKRFMGKYPIKEGLNGLKRIVFEMIPDEVYVEVIHEYIPNKRGTSSGHSCKSYINRIVDGSPERIHYGDPVVYEKGKPYDVSVGRRVELNSTGNCREFDIIVEKELNFNSDLFSTAFIGTDSSYRSITESTPTERRKILVSTMEDVEVLKRYQLNNRNYLTDITSSNKVYTRQLSSYYDKHNSRNKEGVLTQLSNSTSLLESISINRASLLEELNELAIKTSKLNSNEFNDSLLGRIRSTTELMKSAADDVTGIIGGNKTVREVIDSLYSNIDVIVTLDRQFKQLTNDIDMSNSEIDKHMKATESINKMNEIKLFMSNIEVDMNIMAGVTPTGDIMIEHMGKLIANLSEVVSNIEDIISDGADIDLDVNDILNTQVSDNLDKDILELRTAISRFEVAEETLRENNLSPPNDVRDNCNVCSYYNKYGVAATIVNSNTEQYHINISKLDSKTKIMSDILSVRYPVKNLSTKLLPNLIELVGVRNRGNIQKILNLTSDNMPITISNSEYVLSAAIKMRNYVVELHTRYTSLFKELNFIRSAASSGYSDIIDELTIKRDNMVSELVLLTTELRNRESMTTSLGCNCSSDINNKFEVNENIAGMNYPALSLYYSDISDRKAAIHRINKLTEDKKKELFQLDMTYQHNLKNKHNLERDISDIESTNDKLLSLADDINTHTILKEVLDKKIPLILLQRNVSYIENFVNSTMEENNVKLSIQIVVDNDNIKILVNTRNELVPDISVVSSGEKCLLSILVNSALVSMVGYHTICFDEMDGPLDSVYRKVFTNIIYSILDKLDINQIFCISHNISTSTDTTHIIVGKDFDSSVLDSNTNNIIHL